MPVYNYKGVNATGKVVRGTLDAEGQRALKDNLRAKSIFVTEVWEGEKKGESLASKEVDFTRLLARVKTQDVAVLTRLLATLLRAGIPLVEALSALVDQEENPKLRDALDDIRQKVREGTAFYLALKDHPTIFDDLYVNMVRAGESSGKLDVVLERLTEFLDAEVKLRSKIVGALVYPIIMGVVGTIIMIFLFTFVIPQVTQLFADQDRALPFITQVLLFVSSIFSDGWFIVFPALIGSYVGFHFWKKSARGKDTWDRFILKVPVFGALVRMVAISRFAKTLATLLASGVPLLSAMDIVKHILGNNTLVEVITVATTSIREGDSIAATLKRSGHFPPIVTHMIAVGERAGQLEDMLDNVAESYSQQVDLKIQALTTLLEPLMIVIMGGGVAFVVFAIMLPIIQLNEGIV